MGPIPTSQPDTEHEMTTPIKQGDRVRIRPEWQDPGDDEFAWEALEDEDGGRVCIAPMMADLQFLPHYVVTTAMIERAA